MPLVRVEIVKGKSSEYKKTLLDCIHEALVEALHIDFLFQRCNPYLPFLSSTHAPVLCGRFTKHYENIRWCN